MCDINKFQKSKNTNSSIQKHKLVVFIRKSFYRGMLNNISTFSIISTRWQVIKTITLYSSLQQNNLPKPNSQVVEPHSNPAWLQSVLSTAMQCSLTNCVLIYAHYRILGERKAICELSSWKGISSQWVDSKKSSKTQFWEETLPWVNCPNKEFCANAILC